MNKNENQLELKLQAYLDGELPTAELAALEELLSSHTELRLLLEELRLTSIALKGNEQDLKVPETRDFYWSKIARQIETGSRRQETVYQSVSGNLWVSWIRRHLLGLTGTGFAFCLALLIMTPSKQVAMKESEMELASDDMASYTYNDQQEQVKMVWLYDRNSTESQAKDSSMMDSENEQ
jgi:hypothetical protein